MSSVNTTAEWFSMCGKIHERCFNLGTATPPETFSPHPTPHQTCVCFFFFFGGSRPIALSNLSLSLPVKRTTPPSVRGAPTVNVTRQLQEEAVIKQAQLQ